LQCVLEIGILISSSIVGIYFLEYLNVVRRKVGECIRSNPVDRYPIPNSLRKFEGNLSFTEAISYTSMFYILGLPNSSHTPEHKDLGVFRTGSEMFMKGLGIQTTFDEVAAWIVRHQGEFGSDLNMH
jgi:hypothetical protein